VTYLTLKRDITAADLAMDAPDGDEGYPPDYVIGPAGSMVALIDVENNYVEVDGFANDPYAAGFVQRSDVWGLGRR